MIQKLRRMIARLVAVLVALFTLGKVQVNSTGALRSSEGRDTTTHSRRLE